MHHPEKFRFKPDSGDALDDGPERWAGEISIETFGTEEERSANHLRLCREFDEERRKQGIPEEEFKQRLKKAESFAGNTPLLHMTDLNSAVKIFESGKILSISELRKDRPEGEEFKTMTCRNDEDTGLDKFVFFSTLPFDNYGEVALVIDSRVLDRPDCLVTAEDIGEVQRRVGMPYRHYWDEVSLDRESLIKIQEEYKRGVISGKDFQGFFPYFLAVYHENPGEYGYLCRERGKDSGRPWSGIKTLRREIVSESEAWQPRKSVNEQIVPDAKGNYYRETRQSEEDIYYNEQQKTAKPPLPLFPKRWLAPEIKVMREISRKDISYIIVKDQKRADLLIERGVPAELVKVGNFWNPLIRKEHA